MAIAVRLMDVEKSFKYQHRQHGKLKQDSPLNEVTLLVLFYAVECGAKAAYAKKEKVGKRCWLDKKYTTDVKHDLNKIFKKLGIGLTIPFVQSTASEKSSATISSQDLHQAWRYGRPLVDNGQKAVAEKLIEALGMVSELLKEMK